MNLSLRVWKSIKRPIRFESHALPIRRTELSATTWKLYLYRFGVAQNTSNDFASSLIFLGNASRWSSKRSPGRVACCSNLRAATDIPLLLNGFLPALTIAVDAPSVATTLPSAETNVLAPLQHRFQPTLQLRHTIQCLSRSAADSFQMQTAFSSSDPG